MAIEKSTTTFNYRNREIDWLRFNHRVLKEATDKRNPLYERIRFLAIFSSNLDEFFRVRVSKLRQIKKVKKKIRKPLGLRPNKLLKEVLEEIDNQQELFGEIFRNEILPQLRERNIRLVDLNGYTENHKNKLEDYFEKSVHSHLRIMEEGEIKTSAFKEGHLYIAVVNDDANTLRFVEVPTEKFGRFIKIDSSDTEYSYSYLEDLLELNIQKIFPDLKSPQVFNIKISKDAELYLNDEFDGEWVEQIHKSLKKRKVGQPTRLLYERGMPKDIRDALQKILDLGKVDMISGGERHNFSDFFGFPDPTTNPDLHFNSMPPLKHKDFEKASSFFDLVRSKDRLLHFPYQRFEYLETWLFEAADDISVVSIYISLYRIAEESKLTSALLKALNNGKEVTIFVEAKARFDEANNIKWGRRFEEKGGKVFYSFPNVKVHSKILYIQRKENDEIESYAYIGTGNFNSKTSKIYCDHALFTANKKITQDLEQVFRVLKRELLLPKLRTLLISPFNLRMTFEELIQREISNAKQGLPAKISAKMNSLEDKQMIDWLYRASNAGVQIELIVRGFCCLVPQVEGQSENIRVISIVDRFLEHARVFLFHNNGNEELYMGSADWMTRNLDKRIEVITPILDAEIFDELKKILELQFFDTFKARIIDGKSENKYVMPFEGKGLRSQYKIYHFLKSKED